MAQLRGFDVSKYNATPSLAGRAFGFAKATEGTAIDPKYRRHATAIQRGGLVQGAYHFGRAGSEVPVHEQVAAFLAVAHDADLLALDWERPAHFLRNGVWVQPPMMTAIEAAQFIAGCRSAGRAIGLYASRSALPHNLGQAWTWVADYRAGRLAPRLGAPRGLSWRFWQYTSTPYDLDVFNGTRAQLAQLVADSHVHPGS